LVSAHGEEAFEEAEKIIDSKTSCDQLTEDQLEIIGDYYMEQMHPGEDHEIMDERMGGEDSESLRQMHINMALSFYCGEHSVMTSDMMDFMMGRRGIDTQGGDMMVNGMMNWGGFGQGWMFFGWIFMVLFWVAFVLLIIWLYKQVTGTRDVVSVESAIEILKKRYAKGEIDKKEFEEKKKDLEK
jgi:putative membrane protein